MLHGAAGKSVKSTLSLGKLYGIAHRRSVNLAQSREQAIGDHHFSH